MSRSPLQWPMARSSEDPSRVGYCLPICGTVSDNHIAAICINTIPANDTNVFSVLGTYLWIVSLSYKNTAVGMASGRGSSLEGKPADIKPAFKTREIKFIYIWGPEKLSRYSDSLRVGPSGDRIPVGGEIFRTRPDRSWGPHSIIYNGYRVFPEGKAAGAWRWTPTPSSTALNEREELYLYSLSGPSSSVGIATEPRTWRSGIESRWGRDFPPFQTGPGAHTASCKMGTWSFPGVKCGRGVLLTTHPL